MINLTAIFLLAFLTESLVEYFWASLFKKYGLADYLKYLAAAVGVVLCLAYQVDILHQLAGLVPIHPAIGQVLTGIVIGRGGNYLSDFIGAVRSAATSHHKEDTSLSAKMDVPRSRYPEAGASDVRQL